MVFPLYFRWVKTHRQPGPGWTDGGEGAPKRDFFQAEWMVLGSINPGRRQKWYFNPINGG
jgi:hypothetical protein